MGCFWSSEVASRNDSYVRPRACAPSTAYARPSYVTSCKPKPRYGLYKCACGRKWESRLSWPGTFQNCERCRRQVYPCYQRELKPSDMKQGPEKDKMKEHKQELCQMCQKLGSHCGSVRT